MKNVRILVLIFRIHIKLNEIISCAFFFLLYQRYPKPIFIRNVLSHSEMMNAHWNPLRWHEYRTDFVFLNYWWKINLVQLLFGNDFQDVFQPILQYKNIMKVLFGFWIFFRFQTLKNDYFNIHLAPIALLFEPVAI